MNKGVRNVVLLGLLLVGCITMSCELPNNTEKEERTRIRGIDNTTIHIGSSAALTGHAGFLGTQYHKGAAAYFNNVNENGGICGKKIKITVLDDQYNPEKTISNTQQLVFDEKVFSLFNYVGTPTSMAVKPFIVRNNIPAFGFFTGAEAVRSGNNAHVFHLRDSYNHEAESIIYFFTDTLGLKKIGVLYQKDTFGMSVLKGIQRALKKRELEPAVTDTYQRGTLDLQESNDWIFSQEVEAVVLVGTYAPLAKFIKISHEKSEFPFFATVSFVGSSAFANELVNVQSISSKHYEDIIVTQVVPSPYAGALPAAVEYRDLMKKYFPHEAFNYVSFEGFLNAKVLAEALSKTECVFSEKTFRQGFYKITDWDIGIDQKVDFSPENHQGLDKIYYSRLTSDHRFETFTIQEKDRQ